MFYVLFTIFFMNSNNSIHKNIIYNLIYVYSMYACMYMGFVPEINLFVFLNIQS